MHSFELAKATSVAQARELLADSKGSVLKAGGIDLLDHLKEHLLEPSRVVDLKSIPGLDRITVEADSSLKIRPACRSLTPRGPGPARKPLPPRSAMWPRSEATSSSGRAVGTTASSHSSA
jgi:hypothetical protein